MSIATKKGDDGSTGLMYNRRVSKCHPRVEAYGTVDELNASLAWRARQHKPRSCAKVCWPFNRTLVTLMGELATLVEDLPRYVASGFHVVTPELTVKLDHIVKEIEAQNVSFKGWATPGENSSAATLDVARTLCAGRNGASARCRKAVNCTMPKL